MGIWNSRMLISENLLINGRGRLSDAEFNSNPKYNHSGIMTKNPFKENDWDKLPLSTFFVTKGKKYRFRVAFYSFTECPVLVSIEQHDILIIATDSSPVKPTKVKSFIIHSGERYKEYCRATYDIIYIYIYILHSSKMNNFNCIA